MLTTLKQIVQEVSRTPELDAALNRLVTLVKKAMEVDSCSIYLANYDKQQLILAATNGLDQGAVGKVRIGFYEGVIGLVGQREEPLNIENVHQHPHFKHYPEVKEENYNAFLGTPIIYQRKVLGVMTIQQTQMRRFSPDEEAFLVTLATQIALEIANANMLGELIQSESMAQPSGPQMVNGVPGASGLAMGIGVTWNQQVLLSTLVNRRHQNEAYEIIAYRDAVEITRAEVQALSLGLDESLPDDIKAIFTMYDQLLDANSLGREVEKRIKDGWNAATSLKLVVEDYAARFKAMQDPYMQERAVDIIDLSNRILGYILNPTKKPRQFPDKPFILVADEITASMLAECPSDMLQGVISINGSQNSHAAILARALGIPAIMGIASILPSLLDQKTLLIDGYSGAITINPEPQQAREFKQLIAEEQNLNDRIDALSNEPSITLDHHDMHLYVNTGLVVKQELADNTNIKGVGLFRTEIPFMQSDHFPPEQAQYELYRSILQASPDKDITMRTLDVGGDKPLSYLPIVEDNPFLGWRGIRITLDQPEIFLVQARAMIRASEDYTNLQIMLPM
ncbi:MAG: phosphoenolpyruvate--protein phosphotransferase, partial [Glaciecola sp.]